MLLHQTIILLAFVATDFFGICLGNGGSGPELFCIVSPPVLNSDSSSPVTLTAIISGFIDEEEGYSVTFGSRDDPHLVTDSHRATFGKIGTSKGEKGDKGDRPAVVACTAINGEAGEDGLDGSSALPGPPGPCGDPGPQGPMGPDGSDAPGGTGAGANEQYCQDELPECHSSITTRQCVKGQKGEKGGLGIQCEKGRMGEKGEPPKPSLAGVPGLKGNTGTVPGSAGLPGRDASPGTDGFDAPQPNCDLDGNTNLATIMVSYGAQKGDTGDVGESATLGPKGPKGQPGIPAAGTGSLGPQGPKGQPGPVGPPGPTGFSGTTTSGTPGLRIRPRYLGPNPEPQCISNIFVAAKTLMLHKPADVYERDSRFGVFSCDLTSPTYQDHVTVLLNNQQELFPADAKRTHVMSILDSMELCVDDSVPKSCISQLEWVHNGEKTSQLQKFSGSRCMKINRVTPEHAGIYEAYRRPIGRNAKKHAYFLVIVRACPDGFADPPLCETPCSSDCNGHGYCNPDGGDCACAHGFGGSTCSTALGEGNIGQPSPNQIPCLDLGHGRSCRGILVCSALGGCTCPSGWKGPKCDQACSSGTYGPDCCFSCPDDAPVCNRFTGEPCVPITPV